jgi:hypothetical protein
MGINKDMNCALFHGLEGTRHTTDFFYVQSTLNGLARRSKIRELSRHLAELDCD